MGSIWRSPGGDRANLRATQTATRFSAHRQTAFHHYARYPRQPVAMKRRSVPAAFAALVCLKHAQQLCPYRDGREKQAQRRQSYSLFKNRPDHDWPRSEHSLNIVHILF